MESIAPLPLGGSLFARSAAITLSPRDRRILSLAARKLGASRDFGDALRALREATEEIIPAGKTFFLGANAHGPMVGSILSGVGLASGPDGLVMVRVREGECSVLGRFGW
jgi:hypothetical protein